MAHADLQSPEHRLAQSLVLLDISEIIGKKLKNYQLND